MHEKPCSHHAPKFSNSYLAWCDWVHEEAARGERSIQCPTCKRYYFAEEIGAAERPEGENPND